MTFRFRKLCVFIAFCLVCVLSNVNVKAETKCIWGGWVVEKKATCEETGLKYRDCIADPGFPHRDYEIIPALGHKYTKKVKKATCTSLGTIKYTCTVCGKSYSEIGDMPTGHNYQISSIKEATCDNEGEITYKCKNCNDIYTEKIAKKVHNYIKEEKEPTCNSEGIWIFTCEYCGNNYTEVYAEKLEHEFEEEVEESETEIKHIFTCKLCGEEYEEVEEKEPTPSTAVIAPTPTEVPVAIGITPVPTPTVRPVAVTASEKPEAEEPEKMDMTVVNAILAGANMSVLGFGMILLRIDFHVLSWIKNRKKLFLKRIGKVA